MRKILIVAALLAAAPFAASADALSYTYVEGGWTQLQLDNGGGSKPRLDGGYIRGSVAIAEQVHVFGGYTAVTKTYNHNYYDIAVRIKQKVQSPELGIGYHMPWTDRVDFTADAAWVRLDEEFKMSFDGRQVDRLKDHTNVGRVTMGIRGKPSRMTEAWAKAGYMDGGNNFKGTWVGTVGGQINFTKTWGLVGEISGYRDVTQYSAGVRASF
ncbi:MULTISPECIES: hypothetical protein [Stenotrophomonas]|uniref:Outer membrane protein beta-barrel domain-containing protein n=1 Tax=Stenotrophomonas maltophilia TaxID=40324 RepID=A0AAD0BSS1_STEMA|nr:MULTISPECIES: hypothetical protein [Stenotrophomonas]MBW8775178.1 hypothetical protein [Stenotrophomonas sp.]AUI06229.1 hypothetical protein SmaCSM2_03135 [Stenotrophomonas maltophilia]EKU9976146.1 hypothetical protein [Stenotrophomonas maltophilia]MBA2131580.1 hypothetical protein [Stenotrophomonas maltophilia]MBH1528373.1 hypothetical protein [Stenotrophomonas maltophilia]